MSGLLGMIVGNTIRCGSCHVGLNQGGHSVKYKLKRIHLRGLCRIRQVSGRNWSPGISGNTGSRDAERVCQGFYSMVLPKQALATTWKVAQDKRSNLYPIFHPWAGRVWAGSVRQKKAIMAIVSVPPMSTEPTFGWIEQVCSGVL